VTAPEEQEQRRGSPCSYNRAVGATTAGWFTFDDSSGTFETPNAGAAAIDLSLDWVGGIFNEANTQIWQLRFDVPGNLTDWSLGGSSCAFNCVATPGPTAPAGAVFLPGPGGHPGAQV